MIGCATVLRYCLLEGSNLVKGCLDTSAPALMWEGDRIPLHISLSELQHSFDVRFISDQDVERLITTPADIVRIREWWPERVSGVRSGGPAGKGQPCAMHSGGAARERHGPREGDRDSLYA